MTHPNIRRKFMSLLGVHEDYQPGEVIEIRGNFYRFPSFTHVLDAAKGNLSEYRVEDPPAKP